MDVAVKQTTARARTYRVGGALVTVLPFLFGVHLVFD